MREITYEHSFRVNADRNVRQRCGTWLRRLASHLDHRLSLAIEIQTSPALTTGEKTECVNFGLARMAWAVKESARVASAEQVLQFVKDRYGTPS